MYKVALLCVAVVISATGQEVYGKMQCECRPPRPYNSPVTDRLNYFYFIISQVNCLKYKSPTTGYPWSTLARKRWKSKSRKNSPLLWLILRWWIPIPILMPFWTVLLMHILLFFFQGAHFSKDTINRPGFAKIFFESASEERDHAIKIIGYLLMRGGLTKEIGQLIRDPVCIPEYKFCYLHTGLILKHNWTHFA